jgi:hypothetical protein
MPGRTFCRPSAIMRLLWRQAIGRDLENVVLGADGDALHLHFALGIEVEQAVANPVNPPYPAHVGAFRQRSTAFRITTLSASTASSPTYFGHNGAPANDDAA